MTLDEAREIIIKERDSLKANPMIKVEDYLYEAFDVAIKALEQTEEITKLVNELNLEDISSLAFDNMLYCMSIKEIKEIMWKMYCFAMNVKYTVN